MPKDAPLHSIKTGLNRKLSLGSTLSLHCRGQFNSNGNSNGIIVVMVIVVKVMDRERSWAIGYIYILFIYISTLQIIPLCSPIITNHHYIL